MSGILRFLQEVFCLQTLSAAFGRNHVDEIRPSMEEPEAGGQESMTGKSLTQSRKDAKDGNSGNTCD